MVPERTGEAAPQSERLPRAARIHGGVEIRRLLRAGGRRTTPHLEVFVGPAPGPFPRLGTIVPKHRHTVVERNRLRRRLREIGRREVLPALRRAGAHRDVLVRARAGAYRAAYPALRDELVRIAEGLCSEASSSG